MPKKTVQPVIADEKPAFDREAHMAKIEPMVAAAMKQIPLSGTAIDMLRWLKQNSGCGYKNLLRAAWAAAGI
jgi:primosomal protein N'